MLVQAISDEICKLVPEHKAEFQNNTKAYIKKIEKIDKEFREVVAGAKHKEIIFAEDVYKRQDSVSALIDWRY